MDKIKDKKTAKTVQIHLRVSPEEYKAIKEKAKGYPSTISTLLLDAVKQFDDRMGRNRIMRMIEFSEAVRKFDTDMVRVGTNLNQIAHALNLYKYGGVPLAPLETVYKTILETQELNKEVIRAIRHIANKSRR